MVLQSRREELQRRARKSGFFCSSNDVDVKSSTSTFSTSKLSSKQNRKMSSSNGGDVYTPKCVLVTGEFLLFFSRKQKERRKRKRKELWRTTSSKHPDRQNKTRLRKKIKIKKTGGAGFIASHVVSLLVHRYPSIRVIALDKLDYCASLRNLSSVADKPNFKFVKGDICSGDLVSYLLETEKVDAVMHFAAQTHVDNSFGNSLAFTLNNTYGKERRERGVFLIFFLFFFLKDKKSKRKNATSLPSFLSFSNSLSLKTGTHVVLEACRVAGEREGKERRVQRVSWLFQFLFSLSFSSRSERRETFSPLSLFFLFLLLLPPST